MSPRLAGARRGNSLLVWVAGHSTAHLVEVLSEANLRKVLRTGRPQEDGGRLPADTGREPDAQLRDHDRRADSAPRVAVRGWSDARRHGVHRRLLEASFQ